MEIGLGLDAIRNYRRLSYTYWHALAELVDNSTQSYFDNREQLDTVFERESEILRVDIVYGRDNGLVRVSDNAMGMDSDDLERALQIALPPDNTSGRSEYGMGLKTAASWMGNSWSITTKKFGSTREHTVLINVDEVAKGMSELPHTVVEDVDPESHYTTIEVGDLNRRPYGRTQGKIREHLASMYREDLRAGLLKLSWQGERLIWEDGLEQFAKAVDGSPYRKQFAFDINGKGVRGWIGVLETGSRSKAGFSILRAGRVVRGWPDSWRPEAIYGVGGRNDLINQRLVGEIHLDGFGVSHTKDDILWEENEEEEVEKKLKRESETYIQVARDRRKGDEDTRGPSPLEVQTAVEEFQEEINSPDFLDKLTIEEVPPPEAIEETMQPVRDRAMEGDPAFSTVVGTLVVSGYMEPNLSPNDPYVVVDSTTDERVLVVVNMRHPHLQEISGSEGVLNYLRHCTYDALAEWQARHKAGNLDPDTIKSLKDSLLRLPVEIEMHREGG